MPKLAKKPSLRQPVRLTAGERALMCWYPGSPLFHIQAMRTTRAHYPLIAGGNADSTPTPAPRVRGGEQGGHAA